MALVLDTGPILALLDADDPSHDACLALVDGVSEPLVVVAPTLVEIDYWIRKRLQPHVWATFVEDIEVGAYRLETLDAGDLLRVVALGSQYADLGLGMVDAAVDGPRRSTTRMGSSPEVDPRPAAGLPEAPLVAIVVPR